MKKGLVLEGGAMRGVFTCGVIDIFLENGITFDGAVGTSAGACFGCNIKSGQIGRGIRYNKKYCNDRRYASIWNLLRTGELFDAQFCYEEIPFKLDLWDAKAFAENPMEFYSVAFNVETGDSDYHLHTDGLRKDVQYFRASASMPLVSRFVEIDGKNLLDGGIADAIPIRFLESKGYDRNVVVLTQSREYRKKPSSALPLIRLFYRHYPKVAEKMALRHQAYNDTLDYIEVLEKEGKILVIRPEKALEIGRMSKDPEALERVYQKGREAGLLYLDRVRSFLDS